MARALRREATKYLLGPVPWALAGLWLVFLVWAYLEPLRQAGSLVRQAASAPSGIAAALLGNARDISRVLSPGWASNYSLAVWSAIGPYLVVILGAYLGGSEYGWRTLGAALVHSPRWRLVTAKLLLLTLYVAGLVLTTLVLATGLALYASGRMDAQYPQLVSAPVAGLWDRLGGQLVAAVLGPALWGYLAFFAALLLRSSLAGAVIGIGYPYIEAWWLAPYVAGSRLYNWLPAAAQISLLPDVFVYVQGAGVVGKPFLPHFIPFAPALAVTVAYAVVLCAGSLGLFHVQEVR